ncbi:hypothetical protein C5167_039222 [Papaver somniferum]|uniref:Uncharacterized protein n=1 Tax=Papaver somniferum TaxID=3469 RepID=A0A4Y7IF03_PAPSO|nr:hypothetical protein C5167_039222 [Papaver somniferum]
MFCTCNTGWSFHRDLDENGKVNNEVEKLNEVIIEAEQGDIDDDMPLFIILDVVQNLYRVANKAGIQLEMEAGGNCLFLNTFLISTLARVVLNDIDNSHQIRYILQRVYQTI